MLLLRSSGCGMAVRLRAPRVLSLAALRARYADGGDDAAALAAIGETPAAEDLAPEEVAAWTLVANALLNLHATITTG